jgi:hypothetical protein
MTSDTNAITPEDGEQPEQPSFELVAQVVKLLEPLTPQEQTHILQTVLTWLHLKDAPIQVQQPQQISPDSQSRPTSSDKYPFSGRTEISPKEFILEKEPKTDLERLTCLGYYLTHYRNHPYFKTEDLSKLNTDAAQRQFSNAAYTAKNAVRDGYFVQAPKKGFRQLSALGEQYVQALPDREAATKLRQRMRTHTWRSRSKAERSNPTTGSSNTGQ